MQNRWCHADDDNKSHSRLNNYMFFAFFKNNHGLSLLSGYARLKYNTDFLKEPYS